MKIRLFTIRLKLCFHFRRTVKLLENRNFFPPSVWKNLHRMQLEIVFIEDLLVKQWSLPAVGQHGSSNAVPDLVLRGTWNGKGCSWTASLHRGAWNEFSSCSCLLTRMSRAHREQDRWTYEYSERESAFPILGSRTMGKARNKVSSDLLCGFPCALSALVSMIKPSCISYLKQFN